MTHKIDAEVVYLDPSGRDESNRRRAMRAIVFSSLGLLVTSAFELYITVLSGSVALLSDALHNLGDVFTTVGVYFGFRASRKPPTARYPYGFGRAEDLAGIAIVAAIWGSAVLAGWQSYLKLVSGRGTTHLSLGMLAAVIGIVGNQVVARYKLNVGREIKSAPLIVDARHSWLDAVASAGALAGLIGVALGFRVADPVAGFAITALIIHIGIDATRDVASRLMDVNDEEVTDAVRAAAMGVSGVQGLSDTQGQVAGTGAGGSHGHPPLRGPDVHAGARCRPPGSGRCAGGSPRRARGHGRPRARRRRGSEPFARPGLRLTRSGPLPTVS